MNKVERELAGKDLVNSYGVVERFVKNLVIAGSSIIKTKEVIASNLVLVMSNLDNRGDSTGLGTNNLVQISLYSNVIRSREISSFTTLELFELFYKHPQISFQNDNSTIFNYILRKILLHAFLIIAASKY